MQASSWQERGGAGDKTLFADQCTALARERDNSAQPVLLALYKDVLCDVTSDRITYLVAAAPTLAPVTSLPAVVSHPGTEHSGGNREYNLVLIRLMPHTLDCHSTGPRIDSKCAIGRHPGNDRCHMNLWG